VADGLGEGEWLGAAAGEATTVGGVSAVGAAGAVEAAGVVGAIAAVGVVAAVGATDGFGATDGATNGATFGAAEGATDGAAGGALGMAVAVAAVFTLAVAVAAVRVGRAFGLLGVTCGAGSSFGAALALCSPGISGLSNVTASAIATMNREKTIIVQSLDRITNPKIAFVKWVLRIARTGAGRLPMVFAP
jgi:hypothetical protein